MNFHILQVLQTVAVAHMHSPDVICSISIHRGIRKKYHCGQHIWLIWIAYNFCSWWIHLGTRWHIYKFIEQENKSDKYCLTISTPFSTTDDIQKWWVWCYWFSPMMYGQNGMAVNEFLGKSWNKVSIIKANTTFIKCRK